MFSPRALGDLKQKVGHHAAEEIALACSAPLYERGNKVVRTGESYEMTEGQKVLVVRSIHKGPFVAVLPGRPKDWHSCVIVDARPADVRKGGKVTVRAKTAIPVNGKAEGAVLDGNTAQVLFDGQEWHLVCST